MSVELPKDAEGREIPLDTEVLYFKDGSEHKVANWVLYPYEGIRWAIVFDSGVRRDPDVLYLTQPDTWEKLEEDLGRGADALNYEACSYLGKSACDCSSCIADKGETCERVVMHDIASRIRKLRGEDE